MACGVIEDAPRFAYRGMMLDVARHFAGVTTVLRLLDCMASYKLNRFHFHLTDDEGWRLAIGALPELTAVGARRGVAQPRRMLSQLARQPTSTTQQFVVKSASTGASTSSRPRSRPYGRPANMSRKLPKIPSPHGSRL